MSDLMVVVTENIPPRLRGKLALWLVEVRSGVYVGTYSVKVREYIWDTIQREIGFSKGNVVMIWKAASDAGYSLQVIGKSDWKPIDFDGVTLMGYKNETDNCDTIQQCDGC